MNKLRIERQLAYNQNLASDYDDLYLSLRLGESISHDARGIQEMCESSSTLHFLGFIGDTAVAMASTSRPVVFGNKRISYWEDVAVREDFKHRGIGTEMVSFLLDRCREMGATKVELHSALIREAAGKLYEKHGFQQVDTRVFRQIF
jgi:ribosomal protein S18 acetylase RimI-like enzyme